VGLCHGGSVCTGRPFRGLERVDFLSGGHLPILLVGRQVTGSPNPLGPRIGHGTAKEPLLDFDNPGASITRLDDGMTAPTIEIASVLRHEHARNAIFYRFTLQHRFLHTYQPKELKFKNNENSIKKNRTPGPIPFIFGSEFENLSRALRLI
jgi:hypothetical protein